ncbi:MAG TPA: hypothetical protein VIE69_04845 [Methylophilaceae bacterium]|jgi:hypothetical protein
MTNCSGKHANAGRNPEYNTYGEPMVAMRVLLSKQYVVRDFLLAWLYA